jgi:membrane protein implicated in regulation of membrane protease activity
MIWLAYGAFALSSLALAVAVGHWLRRVARRQAERGSPIIRAARARGWM